MKKKNRNILVGTILIVLLLFLFSTGTLKLPLAISSGFTTLGISNIQFTSNDPILNGQAWLLTVSQNGAGQSVYGDSGSISDNSGKSSKPFTISVSLDKNDATYKIYSQGVYIKTVDWTKGTYNPFSKTGGCNSAVWSFWYHPSQLSILGDVYCYNYVNKGVYGTLGGPDFNFQSTISVSGDGGTDNLVISNDQATSGISKNGNVYASWFGSFVSGESAPNPQGQGIIAIYDTSTNGWKTGSQVSYDSWRIYDLSGFASCRSTSSDKSACFKTYNNYATSLMNGYPFSTVGGSVAKTSGTQSNGLVTLSLPKQLQFPGLALRIKASFIGINIPVGKPKIISTSSLTFSTGQTGNIAVTVQNSGDGAGSFDVFATCTDGFSQSGNSLRISSLPAGSTQIVYIPITSNIISGTKSGTCIVTAKDVNDPNNVDTKSVSVSSSSISICTEGQVSIIGNKIQQCQSNVWITTKECAIDETAKYVSGVPACVKENGDEIGFFGKIWGLIKGFFGGIFNFTGNIYSILKNVVVIIIFIFSLLFGKDLIGSFRSLRRKEWLAWLFSLIIAGAIAYFVWKVFFVGLIIFGIFVLLKFVIKLTPLGRFLR